jgi:hypothetical protein
MKGDCNRRIYVKYASDKSIKEQLQIWFIKDHSKAIQFRIINLALRVATCILYIVEVLMNSPTDSYRSHKSRHVPNLKLQIIKFCYFFLFVCYFCLQKCDQPAADVSGDERDGLADRAGLSVHEQRDESVRRLVGH